MATASWFAKPNRTLKGLFGLAIMSAVALGAALNGRGPDPNLEYLPEMAKAPITLSNGAKIYAQRFEVTIAEWNTCHQQGACALALRARPYLDASTTPATGLSYVDVQQYVGWINSLTGRSFRLPTTEEWIEIAAPVMPEEPDPIFTDPSMTWASAYLTESNAPRALKPQGSFSSTPAGVVDLDGSVWEWTQGCYAGSANVSDPTNCPAFYVGGEHIAAMSYLIRDPARGGCAVGAPPAHLGMRLVSDHPT